MDYNALFEDLAANGSRLYKEARLKKFENDKLLETIFNAGLNPFINYWIRKIPEYNPVKINSHRQPEKHVNDLYWALEELDKLSSREFTGHAARDHLKAVLESVVEYDAKVIEKIILGDFKCGVSGSTINKIWPDLIPSYPIMLATASDPKILQGMMFPCFGETKYDGMRFNALCTDKVELKARSGRSFDFHGEMENQFCEGDYMVYDGELWVDDGTGKPMPRAKGNGIISKALKGKISKEEAARVRATVWDAIPYADWLSGRFETPYQERVDSVSLWNESMGDKIYLARREIINNIEEANTMFVEALENGEEGIMLKSLDGIWVDDRVKYQVKFKAENTADMLCVGYEPGKPGSRIEGQIGALKLETADGKIKCSCGSGLNDEDRKKDPSFYLDNIIEIVYNQKIDDSLFLPRFITVRTDKTKANTAEELV